MTLIVAAITREGCISMASDTLITFDGDAPRDPDAHRLTKIVILRHDLAVGVTGFDPQGRIRDLMEFRDAPVDELLSFLEEDMHAGFVVAALGPPQLWEVFGGESYLRTSVGVAWDGIKSEQFAESFRPRFETEWAKTSFDQDVPFRLMATLQSLTLSAEFPTVGGHTMRVAGCDDGFNFLADGGFVLGGPRWTVFAGQGETRGANGILEAGSGRALLYRHQSPDAPVIFYATDPGSFVTIAREEYGQTVRYEAWPWA
jgi:hypothetical protein